MFTADINRDFNSCIFQKLREIDRSKAWLAREAGFSRQQLSNYLKLRRKWSLENALAVMRILDIKFIDFYEQLWQDEYIIAE